MDFTDILKTLAPTAATMLGGPAAGFAVKWLADKLGVPEATQTAVTDAMTSMSMTSEGRIRLAELDAGLKTHAMDVGLDYERLSAQVITEVNRTMQVEAVAEHWPSYGWRPFCGFAFGIAWLGNYFILPLFHIPSALIPSEAWLAMGGILGVASWFRGKAQADPGNPMPNRG